MLSSDDDDAGRSPVPPHAPAVPKRTTESVPATSPQPSPPTPAQSCTRACETRRPRRGPRWRRRWRTRGTHPTRWRTGSTTCRLYASSLTKRQLHPAPRRLRRSRSGPNRRMLGAQTPPGCRLYRERVWWVKCSVSYSCGNRRRLMRCRFPVLACHRRRRPRRPPRRHKRCRP